MDRAGLPSVDWYESDRAQRGARLAFVAGVSVALMFALWAVVEALCSDDPDTVGLLHILRGVTSSLVTGAAVVIVAARDHRNRTASLRSQVTERSIEARSATVVLDTVVATNPNSLIVLDPNRRIVQANETALRVHGTSLVGRACHSTLGGGEACAQCPVHGVLRDGVAQTASHYHRDPRTGEMLCVDVHPLELPRGERFALIVERVVTEQRKMQARLLHHERMAAFGLMSAGIAHDLANPLSAIAMHVELLGCEELPEDASGSLSTIRSEVARLGRTLREMVDFARRRRAEECLVDVGSVAQDAVRLLRHDPRTRGATLEVSTDPEAPSVCMVEDHLMQVVLNLILNGLDALGGVDASDREMRLTVSRSGQDVLLRVRDNGCGMAPDVLGACFEPLYTTKIKGEGTGLGLAICRDIVRGAGGDVEIHSTLGKGTTVSVMLPGSSQPAVQEAC